MQGYPELHQMRSEVDCHRTEKCVDRQLRNSRITGMTLATACAVMCEKCLLREVEHHSLEVCHGS